MDTLFKQILIQAGIYFLFFVIVFVFFNFLSKGYLMNYIIVKSSRGKKVLGRIRSINGTYFKPGKIIEMDRFSYKSRDGMNLVFTLTPNCIKEEMGIKVVDYDEVNKCVTNSEEMVYNFEINKESIPLEGKTIQVSLPMKVQQENPDTNDTLLKRCLMRPTLDKPNILLVIALIGIGITLLATVYGISQMGKYHNEDLYWLQMTYNATIAPKTGITLPG